MTELLLNATTSGKTTFLADGDIIFKAFEFKDYNINS